MIASDTLEIELSIFEDDGITPLDFSAATGFLVGIYQKPGNVIGKYSKVAKTGFVTLQAGQYAEANIGKVIIYLNPEVGSKLDPKKPAYAEFRVSFANANFTGNEQVLTATDIKLEDVFRPIFENTSPA